MTSEISGRFKRWFWRPPRAHGEILADRQVSNLELHRREDGPTRGIVFLQLGILVLLAVFTADAASGGWGFAVMYATYQVFQTGLWYSIWRQDRRDHPEFVPTTAGYVVGMGVSATVIGASALLPATLRLRGRDRCRGRPVGGRA
jgi:low temperature requirement protein LtrA